MARHELPQEQRLTLMSFRLRPEQEHMLRHYAEKTGLSLSMTLRHILEVAFYVLPPPTKRLGKTVRRREDAL